jgi:predicted short-subunit dehydrogenase-like oxidoreductase (DUF2520 family)
MTAPASNTVGIAGSGRIAQALGRLLRSRGNQILIAGRDPAHCSRAAAFIGNGARPTSLAQLARVAPRVLIAVPDSAIPEVATQLAQAGMQSGIALHTCGGLGAEALDSLTRNGVSCGVLHPLQTVATREQGVQVLKGAVYGISGSGAALEWAKQIVVSLEGEILVVPDEHRARYHAAAVIAGNYVVALVDAAEKLMGQVGIAPAAARRAIAPLVRASAENALSLGAAGALTGPIERGDAGSVRNHLAALTDSPPSIRELYLAGARHTLGIARERGLNSGIAGQIEELLCAERQ